MLKLQTFSQTILQSTTPTMFSYVIETHFLDKIKGSNVSLNESYQGLLHALQVSKSTATTKHISVMFKEKCYSF